jgi:UTP--glucose-1-phosphate uridylyltransferase
MNSQVAKAIIPAAGLGRRLRPLTCKVPKEMFPVGNIPAIEWVVKEILEAGIESIGIIISSRKRIIREYFEECTDYKVEWIYQEIPKGLGDAILIAREFVGNYPFLVALPDDLFSGNSAQHLLNHFTGTSLVALWEAEEKDRKDYGDIETEPISEYVFRIIRFALETTNKSNLKVAGRYIITPDVFRLQPKAHGQEELREGMLFNMGMKVLGLQYYGILLHHRKITRIDIAQKLRSGYL